METFVLNGMQSGVISAAILLGLLFFGYWFDGQVEQWGADAEGFTWLLVVVGNSVTLLGIGMLDLVLEWNAGLIGLAAFAASGFFVALGSIRRYVELRRRLKVMARNDKAQGLAE